MASHRTAAVAAGAEGTAQAAADVLRAGGNAVDAAVAAAFASTVCEAGLASLGGGGYLLVDDGDNPVVYDFFVDAPGRGLPPDAPAPSMERIVIGFAATEQVFHAGHGSIAVPGALDGLITAHAERGQLPLRAVVAPARDLAADGFVLEPMQEVVLRLLTGIFSLTDESRRTFLPGRRPRTGDILKNPALAEVLDAVGAGAITGFTDLPGVDELLADVKERGGALTRQDVEGYEVRRRDPLRLRHAGAKLLTNPPPALGGAILASAIALLNAEGPATADPEGAARLVEALRDATEKEKAAHSAATLLSRKGTTHISVVDCDGTLAALTHSSGSCSGVMVPGTGIILNNVMGEEDLHPGGLNQAPAGHRIASMMAPSVLRLPDGSAVAMGSGGSERIRTALLTVLVGLTDRGLDLDEAVHQPRLHWDGREIQAEPGLDRATLARLRTEAGVAEWTELDLYFGGAHVVRRSADGQASGVGDRRRGGAAEVVEL
jgi:gamma-glutamyltranspeptidase/glutathione hydrolase